MDGRCNKGNRDTCSMTTVATREPSGLGEHHTQQSWLRCSIGHRERYEAADTNSRTGRWAGVRASIVASKPGNAGGAKGRREMKA